MTLNGIGGDHIFMLLWNNLIDFIVVNWSFQSRSNSSPCISQILFSVQQTPTTNPTVSTPLSKRFGRHRHLPFNLPNAPSTTILTLLCRCDGLPVYAVCVCNKVRFPGTGQSAHVIGGSRFTRPASNSRRTFLN